jgi:hypothetical protein
MRGAVALLALGGCHAVFALEDLPVERENISGNLIDARLINAPGGLPMRSDRAFSPDEVTGRAVFADGSAADLEFDAEGSFSFQRPIDAVYELSIVALGQELQIQHHARDLKLSLIALGRRERTALKKPTLITLPITTGTNVFPTVVSTGLWASANTANPADVDWRKAVPQSGAVGLLSAAAHDVLYFYSFSPEPATPGQTHYVLDAFTKHETLEMVDGQPVDFPSQPAMQLPNECTRLFTPFAAEQTRIQAAAGSRVGLQYLGGSWAILAFPELEFGANGGQVLAFSAVGEETAMNGADLYFANPFPGTHPAATMTVTYDHEVKHRNGTPIRRGLQTVHYAVLGTEAGCDAKSLVLDVGVPTDWQVAGVPIASENEVVTLPDSPRVAIDFTHAGRADLYNLSLVEVMATNGSTVLGNPIASMRAVAPSISLPTSLFERGHSYLVVYAVSSGYTDSRSGDLRTVRYPAGLAQGVSPVFEIQ